jgi:hypothetical protein
MRTQDEQITAIFTTSGEWNYYTLQMYSGLFWVKDTICGETNIVGDTELPKNKPDLRSTKNN